MLTQNNIKTNIEIQTQKKCKLESPRASNQRGNVQEQSTQREKAITL